MTDTASTKVITDKVRLSYVHVWEPWANAEGQEAKYSVCLLIPKSDKTTLAKIKAAQEAAAEKGKSKFGGKVPSNLKTTLKDGDVDADLEKNPEMAGHFYMTVSARTRPGIVDRNVDPILEQSEVYSGCYARVSMNAFAYNTSGNKGISFGLNHIQKLADGEPLGGRTRAQDDFDEISDDDAALI
jgi:hypothetical protein